jgi:glutathione S-transferase
MKYPSKENVMTENDQNEESSSVVLYQAEGCYKSRLVREALCSLEIPYLSIPMVTGTSHRLPREIADASIPILVDKDNRCDGNVKYISGANECVEYLWETYSDPTQPYPKWWTRIPPEDNIGRSDGAFSIGAYTAFIKGTRAFVPKKALQ